MGKLAGTMEMARSKEKRNDVAVKMDAEVVRLAKAIAALDGITLAEFLTEIAEPIIRERFAKAFQANSPKKGKGEATK